jgi:signal transduction histidine kinase
LSDVPDRSLAIVARLITARADPEEVIEAVLTAAVEATQADRGSISLVDRRNGELAIRKIAGDGWTPETREKRLRAGSGVHEGITGYVATHGAAYHSGDVNHDPRYYPLFDDVLSELAVPLIRSDNRVTGVLDLESTRPHAFTDDDATLVGALAAMAAVAVSMAEHHWRERELAETAQELTRDGDLRRQLQSVTEAAAKILRAYDSSLYLFDADGKRLTLAASHGPLREKVHQATYELNEGLTGWVAAHGTSVRLTDPSSDPRWAGKYQEIPEERIAAFLAAPVLREEKVAGVLRVIRDRTPRSLPNPFDEDDEKVLATLASQVSVLLQREELLGRLMRTERLAAWGQLSARAAHIIGNKVFAMKGAVSELRHLLGDSPHCSEECRELLETLARALSETDGIVQSFKGFVAAREVKPGLLSLNHLVTTQLQAIEHSAGKVQLRSDLAPNLPLVHADASRLGECLGELVENAISWQPEGGEVRISTRVVPAQAAADLAGVHGSSQYVRVDVEDDGPGVPAELKQQIFEAFVSKRGRGLGLGLAICREVVRAQGGEIVEIGTPGQGGHFVIVLPSVENEGGTQDVQDTAR